MTCRLSPALFPALLLAACTGGGTAKPGPDDWRGMLAHGDGVGAEIVLRRQLEAGKPQAALAPYLGEAALEQGDLAEAERWLADAEFSPADAGHGFRMLGRLRLQQGNLPAAGRAFDRALASGRGRDAELWVDIGRLRYRGGEQAQAVAASRKALSLAPENPSALVFAAQLARDAHGAAAALTLLERGLKATPDDPGLLGEYAATLGELGHASDMLAAVRRLAAVTPGDRKVLWLQAVLAARAGQTDLARTLIQRGGDLDQQQPAALLLLALIDMDNGNPDSAAQGLDRLSRLQPDNDRIALLLARALALGGHDRELIARFEARAETPYFAVLVARAYENLGEREKAARLLDSAGAAFVMAPEVRPTTTGTDLAALGAAHDGTDLVALVRGLIAQGRPAAARAQAEAFLRRFPGSADAMALAGDAALQSGDAHAALAHYRAAAAIRRPWSLTKRMVAALDRTGDRAGGTALVADHVAGEPNNADAIAMLARRLAERGDHAGTREQATRAIGMGRNDPQLLRIAAGG